MKSLCWGYIGISTLIATLFPGNGNKQSDYALMHICGTYMQCNITFSGKGDEIVLLAKLCVELEVTDFNKPSTEAQV